VVKFCSCYYGFSTWVWEFGFCYRLRNCHRHTSLIWHAWETSKPSYHRGVTYSITWQIQPLCHISKVPHRKYILDILSHVKFKYSFKYPYKYANFSHENYVDLKKELIVHWCCHFIIATCISTSFSDMGRSFITFAIITSNGLSIKNVA
jgi:hypothetical protein